MVKSIVDAFLSSQEETTFGNLLEKFAIFVSSTVDGGFKSDGLRSVDLEFRRGDTYYIVCIKSGTKWGNSDQLLAMVNNFVADREILRERGVTEKIVAVNGCMYGTEPYPLRDTRTVKGKGKVAVEPDRVYYKYAGQDFWHFISHDDDLYQKIIVPIDEEARKKDEVFKAAYEAKVNEMTIAFMSEFMTPESRIDWVKLVDFVSKRRTAAPLQPGLFVKDEL